MSVGRPPGGIAEHDLLAAVEPHSHHAEVEVAKVLINGLAIGAGDHEVTVPWTRANHVTTSACLAAPGSLSPGGRLGAWSTGTQTVGEGCAEHLAGGGTYIYIASFMRLHGDSYLSQRIFGTGIRLKDVYLDGASTKLLFFAAAPSTLRCWGLVWAK